MAIWYQASQYGSPKITPVEVVKESAQFVTVMQSDWGGKMQEHRRSKGGEFFKTFEEARAHFVAKYERSIQNNRDNYSQLVSFLKKVREMKAI